MTTVLRIGTRGSALARWQAEHVAERLRATAGVEVELVLISTQGDRSQGQGPVSNMGGQGVFTKEIQAALLDGRVDVAVHSLKDLPTDVVDGLTLAAVPERAPVGDVLISRGGVPFAELPPGAVVGTGSLRRRAQMLHVRPDLQMRDLRGNVDTRVRKVQDGEYDAVVLAEAGLHRLGLMHHVSQRLPMSLVLPAVGQGALGIETRASDAVALSITSSSLDHAETRSSVLAERSMLASLRGGCLAPVAAWARVDGATLRLTGLVLSSDGQRRLEVTSDADVLEAEDLGRHVAESLLAQGAAALISAARG